MTTETARQRLIDSAGTQENALGLIIELVTKEELPQEELVGIAEELGRKFRLPRPAIYDSSRIPQANAVFRQNDNFPVTLAASPRGSRN